MKHHNQKSKHIHHPLPHISLCPKVILPSYPPDPTCPATTDLLSIIMGWFAFSGGFFFFSGVFYKWKHTGYFGFGLDSSS